MQSTIVAFLSFQAIVTGHFLEHQAIHHRDNHILGSNYV
jgi:hypothetical protein